MMSVTCGRVFSRSVSGTAFSIGAVIDSAGARLPSWLFELLSAQSSGFRLLALSLRVGLSGVSLLFCAVVVVVAVFRS